MPALRRDAEATQARQLAAYLGPAAHGRHAVCPGQHNADLDPGGVRPFGYLSTLVRWIRDIATSGYWPLAVLVFFASIIVPLFKLLGLSTLLITTHRGTPRWLRERTLIYRVVDSLGRWSMIDVFMVSILTATGRMGRLGSVFPGLSGGVLHCSGAHRAGCPQLQLTIDVGRGKAQQTSRTGHTMLTRPVRQKTPAYGIYANRDHNNCNPIERHAPFFQMPPYAYGS